MNKFVFGGADQKGVYYDEENRRHLNTIRLAYAEAASNLADAGRKEDAKKILNKCDQMMLQSNFAYGMVSRSQQHNQIALQFLIAAYKAGDAALAQKVTTSVKKDMEQQAEYYESLSEDRRDALKSEEDRNNMLLRGLGQIEQQFKNPVPVTETPPTIKTQGVTPARTDTAKPH